ncbi:MAG: hypothetical protein RL272_753 [Candidatus Parcubacteria bacterium]|jgi:hypothetical protein
MKNTKHDIIYGWTGTSQDASGRLRTVAMPRVAVVSPQDMVKI